MRRILSMRTVFGSNIKTILQKICIARKGNNMISKYIVDETEARVENCFKQNNLPVYHMFKIYDINEFVFKTYAEGTEKCFHLGHKVWEIELTYDYWKHYCIKLPTKYVKLDCTITRLREKSNEYMVDCHILGIDEECSYASDFIYSNFKPYEFKECAYHFDYFLLWELRCAPSLRDINTKEEYFNIVFDSRFDQITNSFTVTNLPSSPNLEFIFKRTAKSQYHGNPNLLLCTYRLTCVRTTIFDTVRSDKKWKVEYLCKKLTDEEEDLKNNCIGSCDVEFVKDPVKVTVKYEGQTYDVIDNYESKSVRSFDLRETGNDTDPVNHPNHYEMVGPFESFDIIVESLGIYGARQFCQGNIIKYQTRYKEKNGEEDLKKRHWYSRMDQMLAKCKTIKDYYKLKESDF